MYSIILQSALGLPVNAAQQAAQFVGDTRIILLGIGLVVAAVLLIVFIKKVIINSILGLIAWAILHFVIKVELPFVVSIVVSAVFGLAGLGVLLILRFMGLV